MMSAAFWLSSVQANDIPMTIFMETHNERFSWFIQTSYIPVMYFINSFPASSNLSSADNLCKQFGPRSGLTECQA